MQQKEEQVKLSAQTYHRIKKFAILERWSLYFRDYPVELKWERAVERMRRIAQNRLLNSQI